MKKLLSVNLFLSLSWFPVLAQQPEGTMRKGELGKPNFILVVADDLGFGDLGCYGNQSIKTPHLDQLAREGVRFIDFHSNGAVCSPTRAALLTGRYQQRSGISGVITAKNHRDQGLPLAENTLAEELKKVGYATALFGKWHLGYEKKYNPIRQGFDEFIGFVSGNVDYHSHVDQEGYYDWWKGDELTNQRGYSSDLISNNANDFIKRNQKNPFLLVIAQEAPHSPYQNRNSKADRFPGGISGVDFPVSGSETNVPAMYKDMVETMDENLGKTMRLLKELELDSQTIVIFCSDNGANKNGSNAHLKGFKGSIWEGGHRVPAIIWGPGRIEPGWISQETMLSMDIFPTILELAGTSPCNEMDGISLAGHLISKRPLAARSLFWQIGDSYAIRKDNWKLVVSKDNKTPELYDLKQDPQESRNVSATNTGLVKTLSGEIEAWQKKVSK